MSRIHAPGQARISTSDVGRSRRPPRRSRGQALVEFAVVLPVFLLILAGVIDFGLGLYSQMTVINAAREGARYAVVNTPLNTSNVTNRVEAMTGGLDQSQLTVNVSCQASCASGDTVVVRVDYDYHMLWPLAFGNSIDLSSTVQMRIE